MGVCRNPSKCKASRRFCNPSPPYNWVSAPGVPRGMVPPPPSRTAFAPSPPAVVSPCPLAIRLGVLVLRLLAAALVPPASAALPRPSPTRLCLRAAVLTASAASALSALPPHPPPAGFHHKWWAILSAPLPPSPSPPRARGCAPLPPNPLPLRGRGSWTTSVDTAPGIDIDTSWVDFCPTCIADQIKPRLSPTQLSLTCVRPRLRPCVRAPDTLCHPGGEIPLKGLKTPRNARHSFGFLSDFCVRFM